MLRNDATHFNGKFNQKDVARQIFVRFLCLSQGFLVSGLGGVGFWEMYKKK